MHLIAAGRDPCHPGTGRRRAAAPHAPTCDPRSDVAECYRTNREVFDRITALGGERVPKLEPAADA